ncbi:MAG: YhbY family RNA-binding protein [Candidatus Woesearchaeota archaeon]|nr:YhbY family RNA-binding protein [Candidatus Woesearchaeota archaeon]
MEKPLKSFKKSKSIKQLRKEAMNISPSMHVGKKGLTSECLEEIRNQLNKKGLVKIKFLKTSMVNSNRKAIAEKIAKATDSKLISLMGFIATFFKENRTKKA